MDAMIRPEELTTEAVDYLQRTGDGPAVLDLQRTRVRRDLGGRRLFRVVGVGRLEKEVLPRPGEAFRAMTQDLLTALFNYRVPVALEVAATTETGPRIAIGTWLSEAAPPGMLDEHARILETGLLSLYPRIDLEDVAAATPRTGPGGLVLGIPTIKPPELLDGSLPMDRLIRSMGGGPWAALVLAEPVVENDIRNLRLRVLNEMRAVAGAPLGAGGRPLAEHYVELLRLWLANLTHGQGIGSWRTAVYLAGDRSSFYRLASVWRGIFSGPESLPEPVRVYDDPAALELMATWALPDTVPEARTPGYFRHPFTHQTLLSSAQLAAYVHLPQLEAAGFSVTLVPDFDVVPAKVIGDRIVLGRVLERNRQESLELDIARDQLTSHVFVAGVTGAGKTNTVFQFLVQAADNGVPFLVIEPAKTEYRALLERPGVGDQLVAFTLANETVAPLRLNPFQFPEGIPVGVHIDLIRSVFHASFGMWTPLPQVLEICLQEIYEDRGWNLATSTNYRTGAGGDRSPAFPTLTELVAKVDVVAGQLGYEERITADIRAALRTRLNSLRSGAKGHMLDVRRSMPMDSLLSRPTVLELEGLGDDDDKAFVMGLILVALAEHRRVAGQSRSLRHLLVIEEAHRLLSSSSGPRMEGEADVRGKAVETFANLLAEVRAYGQGVVVVDQIPSKLSPDVMKNTSVKVAHRVVAGDDRQALAAAMAMTERQARAVTSLETGVAAVFVAGADAPLLVKVNEIEEKSRGGQVTDEAVRSRWAEYAAATELPNGPVGDSTEDNSSARSRRIARDIVESRGFRRVFARVVLSLIEEPMALDRMWPELLAAIDLHRPPKVNSTQLVGAVVELAAGWLAERRGAQSDWTYAEAEGFRARLHRAFAAKLDEVDVAASIGEFRTYAHTLHQRRNDPYRRAAGSAASSRRSACIAPRRRI